MKIRKAIQKSLTPRRILLLAITLPVIFVVIFTGGFVWHFRPLLENNDIAVFEINGEQRIPMQVYSRLGFPEEYWFRSSNRHFVFLSDSQRILVPNTLEHRPYLHYNHDMALGVAVDDEIKGDGEYLSRNDKIITFRSGKYIYEIRL